jgi:hypothetical protein
VGSKRLRFDTLCPTCFYAPSVSANPHDPHFTRWLRSLKPRQELVIRCALGVRFPAIRADRDNTARVDELTQTMQLDEHRLAMIIADAKMIAQDIEKVISETPTAAETEVTH